MSPLPNICLSCGIHMVDAPRCNRWTRAKPAPEKRPTRPPWPAAKLQARRLALLAGNERG